VFGFLLFDSRPSHQVVQRFAQEQARWIDELARGAGIYFFFPFKKEGKEYKNPSTEVVRLFKLGIARLPGIILFAPPTKDGKLLNEQAVYIPLKEDDFNAIRVYERIFIDLFELIRVSLEKNNTSQDAIAYIKEELGRLRKQKSRRGFASYIRKGAHLVLVDIPKALYGPFAEGFGKALGEKAAGP
jgi:hypothetical protein